MLLKDFFTIILFDIWWKESSSMYNAQRGILFIVTIFDVCPFFFFLWWIKRLPSSTISFTFNQKSRSSTTAPKKIARAKIVCDLCLGINIIACVCVCVCGVLLSTFFIHSFFHTIETLKTLHLSYGYERAHSLSRKTHTHTQSVKIQNSIFIFINEIGRNAWKTMLYLCVSVS